MKYASPEQMGISSAKVLQFFKTLEYYNLSVHSVILSRGDNVFAECYYAPFDENFNHRMYSTSKSMVSLAIGFCVQDGLVELDAPLVKYFPEYSDYPVQPDTTVREMLQMRTSHPSVGWFDNVKDDRAALYFMNKGRKQAGTIFSYDSQGSFMLCTLVEKVTGKPFVEYLKEKVFDEIGTWKNAYALQCPGGHSWGDSGVMCTVRDLWHFARFVLNGGTWNGKRYLNEEYLKKATTPSVPNNPYGFTDWHGMQGYGYQFWGAPRGCFCTHGMGGQVTLCDPEHDFIMAITQDNQGNGNAYEFLLSALYTCIIDNLGEPLPEDPAAKAELDAYLTNRKLFCLKESATSPLANRINGKVFDCAPSSTGIKWFRLDFKGDEGSFTYENAQGEKCMRFGFGHNVFEKFPQEGYSDTVGTVGVPGHKYDAAFSADWPAENTLRVRVQIIDKYFGNLSMRIGFRNEDTATISFEKAAEAFLEEYKGYVDAVLRK